MASSASGFGLRTIEPRNVIEGALQGIAVPIGARSVAEQTTQVRFAGNLNAAGALPGGGSVLNLSSTTTAGFSLIAGATVPAGAGNLLETASLLTEIEDPAVWAVILQIEAGNQCPHPTFTFRNFFGYNRFMKMSFQQQGDPTYAKPEGHGIPNQDDFYMKQGVRSKLPVASYIETARSKAGYDFRFVKIVRPADAFVAGIREIDMKQALLKAYRAQANHFVVCAGALQSAVISSKLEYVAMRNIVDIPDDDDPPLPYSLRNPHMIVVELDETDAEEMEGALQENDAIRNRRGMGTAASRPDAPAGARIQCGVCGENTPSNKIWRMR